MQFMDHSKVNHDLQGTNSYGSKSGHPTLYPESETCVPLMWDAKKMGSDISGLHKKPRSNKQLETPHKKKVSFCSLCTNL